MRLRGLPLGTTLVLINGRRLEGGGVSAYSGGFFDLNAIPASVIDRIEIVPEGSSAVYGSDAMACAWLNITRAGLLEGVQAGVRAMGPLQASMKPPPTRRWVTPGSAARRRW